MRKIVLHFLRFVLLSELNSLNVYDLTHTQPLKNKREREIMLYF